MYINFGLYFLLVIKIYLVLLKVVFFFIIYSINILMIFVR